MNEERAKSGARENRVPFKNENAYIRHFRSYLNYCEGGEDGRRSGRIVNSAGFCAFCRITTAEFRMLRQLYPRTYDIMQSYFIDAAVNNKLYNSGPVMDYLLNSINRMDDGGTEYAVMMDDADGDAV